MSLYRRLRTGPPGGPGRREIGWLGPCWATPRMSTNWRWRKRVLWMTGRVERLVCDDAVSAYPAERARAIGGTRAAVLAVTGGPGRSELSHVGGPGGGRATRRDPLARYPPTDQQDRSRGPLCPSPDPWKSTTDPDTASEPT